MVSINYFVIIVLLIISSCKNLSKNTKNPVDDIYGNWKFEKELWKDLTKFNAIEVNKIKKSKLHIEKDKIYIEGITFVDTCNFSSSTIRISKLFDKKNEEYYWYEEGITLLLRIKDTGPLPTVYTKKELSEINLIELGCGYDLGILYLKQDTLILNYLGGVTFYLTKISEK